MTPATIIGLLIADGAFAGIVALVLIVPRMANLDNQLAGRELDLNVI